MARSDVVLKRLSPATVQQWDQSKNAVYEANRIADEAREALQNVKAGIAKELTGLEVGDLVKLQDWAGKGDQLAVVVGFKGDGWSQFGEVDLRHLKKDGSVGKRKSKIQPEKNLAWGDDADRFMGDMWEATGDRYLVGRRNRCD